MPVQIHDECCPVRSARKFLDVGSVLQDDLGHVLESDVAHAAVAADCPDLGELVNFLVGHERISEVDEVVGMLRVEAGGVAEDEVGETLGKNGALGVVDDEAFPDESADGDAVLEERVHPRIGVRVVGSG